MRTTNIQGLIIRHPFLKFVYYNPVEFFHNCCEGVTKSVDKSYQAKMR